MKINDILEGNVIPFPTRPTLYRAKIHEKDHNDNAMSSNIIDVSDEPFKIFQERIIHEYGDDYLITFERKIPGGKWQYVNGFSGADQRIGNIN